MVFIKGRNGKKKRISFEMVVCCLQFTTLALVHPAYFTFQSLAWVGKEDGSFLLSLFAHPTLYIPFQVQVDIKARLGAEAFFSFTMYGRVHYVILYLV